MIRSRPFKAEGAREEENPYWISFSDVMAGIVVLFMLASVALMLEMAVEKAEVDAAIMSASEADQVRIALLTDVERELKSKGIPVEIVESHTVIRIPEEAISFRQGEYAIPENSDSMKNALEVGRVLYDALVIAGRTEHLDTISIEGHTDSAPYNNVGIKGNWGLSTFRAISVWEFWNEHLGARDLGSLVNHSGQPLFSVSGFGSTRPDPSTISDLDSEESRSKNRRIDLRITIKRPAIESYKSLKKMLGNGR